MTEDDRLEWCMAALATIGDMPEDLLDEACRAGRKRCDHPAKIVPFICDDESKAAKPWLDTLRYRKQNLQSARARFANVNAPRLEAKPFELPEGERKELATDIGSLVKEMERKVAASQC